MHTFTRLLMAALGPRHTPSDSQGEETGAQRSKGLGCSVRRHLEGSVRTLSAAVLLLRCVLGRDHEAGVSRGCREWTSVQVGLFRHPWTQLPQGRKHSGSLPTVCPAGPGLSLATSAPGQMHPRNILEPVGDTSLEIPTMASPGLSSGFPWQPSLPMVHADSRGPGCG